jgi:hypothetical protein
MPSHRKSLSGALRLMTLCMPFASSADSLRLCSQPPGD